MATFLDLQTRVARYVIDAPASVQADLPTIIRNVYRTAQEKHNFWCMKAEVLYTTVAGLRVLGARPNDYKEFRGKPYRIPQFGRPVRIQFTASSLIVNSTIGPQDEGPPSYLGEGLPTVDGEVNWTVHPLPDGGSDYDDGEYQVVVPYWKYMPVLAAPTDTSWLTVKGEEFLVMKSSAKCFELDWNDQNSITFEGLAKIEWQALLQADMTQVLSGMDTLVPYQGAWADIDNS